MQTTLLPVLAGGPGSILCVREIQISVGPGFEDARDHLKIRVHHISFFSTCWVWFCVVKKRFRGIMHLIVQTKCQSGTNLLR